MSSKKNYNEGLEAGIKIAEKVVQKESETMEYLKVKIDKIANLQGGVREAVDNILNYQNDLAVEKYYGICNNLSPCDLEEPEKKVLLDVLTTIAINSNDYNKDQGTYFSNLKHFLSLSNYSPNSGYQFELLENIRDLDHQEIMYKCILEFLFLQECDFSTVDEYEELFDLFSVKNKVVERIMSLIDMTYYLFGKNGILEMYGSHILEKNISTENEETEEYDNKEVKLAKLVIHSEIEIKENEERTFENQALFFRANIKCAGKLKFKNCKLFYYEEGVDSRIILHKSCDIEIDSCVIKGYGVRENEYFIHESDSRSKCHIKRCIFEESAFFAKMTSAEIVEIENCEFLNCLSIVSTIYSDNQSSIKKCFVKMEKYPEYIDENVIGKMNFSTTPALFELSPKTIVCNCRFVGNADFDIYGWQDDYSKVYTAIKYAGEISNCTFMNMSSEINGKVIKGCIFNNCAKCISMSSIYEEGKEIHDCLFEKCVSVMNVGKHTSISNCQFLTCQNPIIDAEDKSSVNYCQFYNIKVNGEDGIYGDPCALIFHCYENYSDCTLEDCDFNGIQAGNGFLVAVNSYKGITPRILYMTNCKLENCSTQRSSGLVIKGHYTYFGLFNKQKKAEGIDSSNLTGFGKSPKESSEFYDYKVKEKDKYGNIIGASEDVKKELSGYIPNQIAKEEIYF